MSDADVFAEIRPLLATNPNVALERLADILSQSQGVTLALGHQLRSRGLRALGRHDEALFAIADAKSVADQEGDPILAARVQIGAVDSLAMLGRYTEATDLANALAAELTAAGVTVDAAKVLGNLGSIALRQDRYADALTAYTSAEALLTPGAEPLLEAGLAINRAIALSYLGKDEEALAGYNRALDIYTERELTFEAAVARSNIGFLHATMGRPAVALAELTSAYPVFVSADRSHEAARCDLDTGDAYRSLNLLDEARLCYERALAVFQASPLAEDFGRAHLGLAAVSVEQQRFTDATTHLAHAEQHFVATGNQAQQAHIHLCRAGLALAQNQPETAVAEAQAAQAGFQTASLDGWAAEAAFVIALATPGAQPQDFLAVADAARQTARGWLECRAEHAVGNLYHAQGNFAQARTHLQAAIAALESVRTQVAPEDWHLAFLKDKETVYGDLVALLLEGTPSEEDTAEALAIVERSRSRLLLERLLAAKPAAAGGPDAFQERLWQIRAELNRAYRDSLALDADATRRPGTSLLSHLVHLEADYARALQEAERHADFPDTLRPFSLPARSSLQESLEPDETLLLFTQIRDRYAVFLVGHNRILVRQDLASVREVNHVARRFRYHLQKRHATPEVRSIIAPDAPDEADAIFQRLYDLLLRPLESDLTGNRLIIIPHGPLHGLPFHAFHDGTQYLLDRMEVQYAPSATIWHTLTRRPDSPVALTAPALLLGVPGPGTEEVPSELASIADELPARTLLGKDATIPAFREAAPTASFLHLATHALFRRDNPLFSGLQMADGWLLARDLYEISLSAHLVTLSACDTGALRIDPGEEWMGLARGFLAAGAKRLLVSLWPADDKATAKLMRHFYAMLSRGEPATTALQRAQQQLRAERPHPYYWATFCLIGKR